MYSSQGKNGGRMEPPTINMKSICKWTTDDKKIDPNIQIIMDVRLKTNVQLQAG